VAWARGRVKTIRDGKSSHNRLGEVSKVLVKKKRGDQKRTPVPKKRKKRCSATRPRRLNASYASSRINKKRNNQCGGQRRWEATEVKAPSSIFKGNTKES